MPVQDEHIVLVVPDNTVSPQILHVFISPIYIEIVDKLFVMFNNHRNLLLIRLLTKARVLIPKTLL